MQIITKLNKAKRISRISRKNLRDMKKSAHRRYRRCAKQALHNEKEINEKPRLTNWDIV